MREDASGKTALEVDDLGEPELRKIATKIRVFRGRLSAAERPPLPLPDKPSLVVPGRLVDVASRAHLWADRFDGGLEDVFDLQDQVNASVVAAIELNLRTAEIQRAQRKPADIISTGTHVPPSWQCKDLPGYAST